MSIFENVSETTGFLTYSVWDGPFSFLTHSVDVLEQVSKCCVCDLMQRTGAQKIGVHTGPLQQGQIYSGGMSAWLPVSPVERKFSLRVEIFGFFVIVLARCNKGPP